MPHLISEVLVDIAKKVVENGNQTDVYKFAMSGKEPFKAMKEVFASVTVLKIYERYYEIGWDKKCCKFEFQSDKPHSDFLMKQIGSRVDNILIDTDILSSIYEQLMTKIIEKQKVTSIYIGDKCGFGFLHCFLPQFAKSLKNVIIPSDKMIPSFRDSLSLECLTIMDPLGNGFNLQNKYAFFCCKTTSLKFEYRQQWDSIRISYFANILHASQISPHYSSIKTLILEDARICDFWTVLKFFPSLEMFKLESTMKRLEDNRSHLELYVTNLCDEIAATVIVPSRVTLLFCKAEKKLDFPSLDKCKEICVGFEYIETAKDYHCFQKTVQCASKKSTTFEVQIAKYLFAKKA